MEPLDQSRDDYPVLDQLKEISNDIDASWQTVVNAMRHATFEYIPTLTKHERKALYTNFWQVHADILLDYEQQYPGVTEEIMSRMEIIAGIHRYETQREDVLRLPPEIEQSVIRGGRWLQALIGWPLDQPKR